MGEAIIKWFVSNLQLLPVKSTTLELGSLDVNGSVREYMGPEYVGIDIEDGDSVDVVMNANDIGKKFEENEFDCVLALDLLEHDKYFWKTLAGVKKVLKPGGIFVVVVPTFFFPVHRYPKDYWRIGEDGMREVVFDGYELLKLDKVFTKAKEVNPVLCGVGKWKG